MSFSEYYMLLSTFVRAFTQPISDLADTLSIPPVSALLFGFIGALSPCQLSSNLAALAWVSRVAGLIFLLVGLNETVLYWLL